MLTVRDNSTGAIVYQSQFLPSLASQRRRLGAAGPRALEDESFEFSIKNAKLWWTWNLGTPYLYKFTVQVSHLANPNHYLDYKTTSVGLRTIKWEQDLDANGFGSSFYAVLNGVPVYMRGSNYIPPDMFMPRALRNPDVYNKTIQAAIDGNQNMLRLWGGGQYEHDLFYDMCDASGILIWHDMMFACAMYPAEPDMLASIKQETLDNVRRLRNHPSIALWNGNNEVLIGWEHWGWQDNLNDAQKQIVFGWYTEIFEVTLREVVAQEDPDRFYWPTSPTSQAPGNYSFGDIH